MDQERRLFSRATVRVQAEVSDGSLNLMACETRDLSLQGVFVMSDVLLPLRTPCTLTFVLEGLVLPIELKLKAEVVRCQPDGLGLRFCAIDNLETYQHLRNLVLYNSPEPDQVLAEECRHLARMPNWP